MSDRMTSFERVKTALDHREPDRVPFDLGGSVLTGMHRIAYQNLRRYLGLPDREVEIYDPIQQLARIHDDMLDALRVDVRCVDPCPPDSRPLATDVARNGDYLQFSDEWGIVWVMPANTGLYFDMRVHPLAAAETVADLERYPWADPDDPSRFETMKERADQFVNDEKRAYILGRHAAGIFEVALWMRGYEQFLTDLCVDPGFAEALLDIILENKMKYWRRALQTVGENVLIVSEADDLATQFSPFVSPGLYEQFVSPRHRKLFDMIKKEAAGKVHIFYHSCGAIMDLIPCLIEEGVDILNPVQVSAAGMDTRELKRLYGAEVSFWGGGIDTQRILPHGTPEEVRAEVRKRIDDLAPGGGFIFNTVHNVQADVPPRNYMAMWEALQEYGRY